MTDLYHQLSKGLGQRVLANLENTCSDRVMSVISKPRKDTADLALLLSPGADQVLESMAIWANRITQARFGNVVGLYAPLYISNKCTGNCPYCGFKYTEKIKRTTLSPEQIEQEAIALKDSDIRHVLLVSGDSPKSTGFEYTLNAAQILKRHFPSVSVEVPPLSTDQYKALIHAGVDGVTLYQETYHKPTYDELHKNGPKEDYMYRLTALNRAGDAGMRKLNIGALWGLSPWRMEALRVGIHARYLEKAYWRSQILIGMPRLHNVPSDFSVAHRVADRDFCHIILAMRLFVNDAGIVISTRERPEFRDNLVPLGATVFSAGSKTEPGGYALDSSSGSQFSIEDHRSPAAVQKDLSRQGYDPVLKDWDNGFIG